MRSNSQDPVTKSGRDVKCYEIFACCGDQCHLCPAMEAFKTGKACAGEFTHTTTKNIYNISAYPLYNENNDLYGMAVYVNDVTVKRRMEAQLFQSAKLAAIGEMAAGVAHELNSPLTAIIGNSSLILRGAPLDEKYLKLLRDIKSCGQRSKRIIQNLLTFARQDSYNLRSSFHQRRGGEQFVPGFLSNRKNKITINKNLNPHIPPLWAISCSWSRW